MPVETTMDLYRTMLERCPEQDVVIQAAAPADYRPTHPSQQKLKKTTNPLLTLELTENPDVAAAVAEHRQPNQVLIGFAAETRDMLASARDKRARKQLDMIVANDVTLPGAGFGTDTNIATLVTAAGETSYPLMSKRELAERILDEALAIRGRFGKA